MEIENIHSFEAALRNGVGLFLGAGFSVCARSNRPFNNGLTKELALPLGGALAIEIADYFSVPQYSSLPLPKLLTVLKATKRDDVLDYLTKRYTVTGFDQRYLSILRLAIESIFTTNIDDLVPKITIGAGDKYLSDVTVRGPVVSDRSAIKYFPLHGSVGRPTDGYRFTVEELVTAFGDDPDRWHFLSKEVQRLPTIFWGYSLEDAGVIEALSERVNKNRSNTPNWIVLREPDNAAIAYFKAQGFDIISASTDELLGYISRFVPKQAESGAAHRSTKELFPSYYIPSIHEVKVRPIADFLAGDEPEWFDIFGTELSRTHHYRALMDSLYSGAHTFFVGVPGSGKSTLLRQLASDFNFSGHKLFVTLITTEMVDALASRLNGQRAIVFVDDAAEDAAALGRLLSLDNVQLVGCAREFSFDLISHRLELARIRVRNVSELSELDVQAIFDRIPSGVRVASYRHPQERDDGSVSFFEVIEQNVVGPSLAKRMSKAMAEIRAEDIRLLEIFLVTAYVGSCGTPITTDMLHAFLRPHGVDVVEVPKLVQQLGSQLRAYSGRHEDDLQDNYVVRSKIMSEAILDQVDQLEFRRVFEQFHSEVSPYRICRFDVFRRKAFDERHASKAFPKWEDGLRFFDSAFSRDGSPELLQQCALYLSKRRRFVEAFQWIDRARRAAPRSFSIRNSHAIILFRANIGLYQEDPSVLPLLEQSMAILAECYKSDKRKVYHAIVYATQAMELRDAVGAEHAGRHLIDARVWIAAEMARQQWSRHLGYISRRLSRYL